MNIHVGVSRNADAKQANRRYKRALQQASMAGHQRMFMQYCNPGHWVETVENGCILASQLLPWTNSRCLVI